MRMAFPAAELVMVYTTPGSSSAKAGPNVKSDARKADTMPRLKKYFVIETSDLWVGSSSEIPRRCDRKK
jgi:hypothetical protein